MDSVTHIAVGATLGYALGPRTLKLPDRARQVGVIALAAVIPDIDWIVGVIKPSWYLRIYHGPTHSLLGACVLAALVAVAATRWARVSNPWLLAFLGIASHLFLDAFTGFGEAFFWPITNHRFGYVLMANYDLTTFLILLTLMAIPAILNAINREIGATRVNAALAAWIALGLIVALLPVRALWKTRAYEHAHGQPMTEDPDSVNVYPSAIMPWVWNAVEDTPIAYMVYEVNGQTGLNRPFMTRFRKPQSNNYFTTAQESETGTEFLAMAAAPFYQLEDGRKAPLVRIIDLAFYTPGGSRKPFSVEIETKSTKEVVAERVNF